MLIIANQEKNLFKSINEIDELEIYQEEIDIEIYRKDDYKFARPKLGNWIFSVNCKVYGKYHTTEEKNYIVSELIKAIRYNKKIFIFPIFDKMNKLCKENINE